MKFLKYILITLGLFLGFSTINAQSTTKKKFAKETVYVKGVCKMCKARIEKAALVKGVIMADWDKQTQFLTVTYKTKKTDLDKICQAITDSGHEAGALKVDETVYEVLPDCCQYNERETH